MKNHYSIFTCCKCFFGNDKLSTRSRSSKRSNSPADVTELTVTNKDASVLLTWTDATDEDIYGYEVAWNKNAPIILLPKKHLF